MTSLADKPVKRSAARSEQDSLCAALEDYQRRTERGEMPAIDQFVEEYPQHESELRACLAGLQQIQQLALSLSSTDGPERSPHEELATGTLGDYRLVREVGRGGMGIVYEAQQISLSRRVALKILPFAAVLDPRHLQRFKNEALAAANLDHPNIVEVYGVGCERGIHFYAMRLVEGVTLAEVVADSATRDDVSHTSFDNPSADKHDTSPVLQAAISTINGRVPQQRFRRIAELGIQAAEALEHAHQMGIVHRDIKPSNLMIDERGKLWITDFGLARNTADAGMTMTGDLVGTLRYMSPEQAESRNAILDHRTDIYSLGATMYELATDRPVVQAQERAAILREIAETDPASPRKYTPGMPADLETILLKCLNKESTARYDSAKALAEDLRRFLEQKPIVARRPSAWDRAGKWTRRHRSALTSISATLLVALSATAVLLWRASLVAERNANRANVNLDLARDTIDALFVDYLGDDLGEAGPLTQREQQMLEKALEFYQNAAEQNAQDPHRLPAVVRVYTNIARALYHAKKYEKAQQAAEHALRMFDSLLPEEQQDPKVNESRFTNLGILAGSHVMQHRNAEATAVLLNTERLMKEPATDFTKLPNAREIEVRHKFQIGLMHYIQLQHEDALIAYRAALDGARALAQVKPDDSAVHVQIGDIMHSMGHASLCLGYLSAGQKWFDSAIKELLEARRLDPSEPEVLRLLEWVRMDRATLLRERGKEQEALLALREAAETVEELSSDSSVSFEHCENRAKLLSFLIQLEALNGDAEHITETRSRIDRTLTRLARGFPDEPAARSSAAITRYDVGTSLLLGGRHEAAVEDLMKADAAITSLVNDLPDVEEYRHHLAMARYNLANAYLNSGDRSSAERFWVASQREWEKLAEQHPDNSEYESRVAACLNSQAMHAREDHGRPLEAVALATEAIRHQNIARSLPSPFEMCDEFLIQHYENLVRSLLAAGDHERVDAVMDDYFADRFQPVQQSICAASYYCQCADLAAIDDRYDSEHRASLTRRYLNKATDALGKAGPGVILSPSSWGLLEDRKQEIAKRRQQPNLTLTIEDE
jgi:serine/threonine protein kinase